MRSYIEAGARSGARGNRVLLLTVACLTLLSVGCRDEGVAPAATQIARNGDADQGDQPCDLCNGDGGGNPNDSHYSASVVSTTVVTFTSDIPFYDPVADQTVTSVTFPEVRDSTRVAGAYDYSGTVILDFSEAPEQGARVARTRIIGDNIYLYDQYGTLVPDTVAGPFLLEQAGGTFAGTVVTDTAILGDGEAGMRALSASTTVAPSTRGVVGRGAEKSGGANVSVSGDQMRVTSSIDDPAQGRRGQRVVTYRRSRGSWVMAAERIEEQTIERGMTSTRTTSTEFRNVRWKVNAERNAQRRVERAKRLAEIAAGRGRAAKPQRAASLHAQPRVALRPVSGAKPGKTTGAALAAATNIPLVLQHGAFSDASTWAQFEPRLNQAYTFPLTLKPSLEWKKPISQQGIDLRNQMLNTGQSQFLLIGHSNGGLVSRWVGQQSSGSPGSLTKGVVTIGTPNKGVHLAKNGRQIVSDIMTRNLDKVVTAAAGRCGNRNFGKICEWMQDTKATWLPRVVNYALDNAVPMSLDVAPGSSFLNSLNSTSEGFYKWGVTVKSEGRWQWLRMLGDWKCEQGSNCDGASLQNYMATVYAALQKCSNAAVAGIFGRDIADRCRATRWAVNDVDQTWQRWTLSYANQGDGLVVDASQDYPNTPGKVPVQITFPNAQASHVSETKSVKIADKISSDVIPTLTQYQ